MQSFRFQIGGIILSDHRYIVCVYSDEGTQKCYFETLEEAKEYREILEADGRDYAVDIYEEQKDAFNHQYHRTVVID